MPRYTKELVVASSFPGEDREGKKLTFTLAIPGPDGAHYAQVYNDTVLDPPDELVALMKYGAKVVMSFDAPEAKS